MDRLRCSMPILLDQTGVLSFSTLAQVLQLFASSRARSSALTLEDALRHRASPLPGRELLRQDLQLLAVVLREFQMAVLAPSKSTVLKL